ncbi:MAG: glycosyltransferase family 4 protein [Burkholderiales bacterium]|nr:glycosyltransferase family 4 protein [Burkholderiales bacterium]
MYRHAQPRHEDPRPVACLSANTTWYVVNFRSRLIASLIEQGWRVVVLSPTDRHVSRLIACGAEHVPLELDNAGTNPLRELHTLWSIRRALKQIAPSVVLTFTPKVNIYLSMAARSLHVPVIANISGLGRGFESRGWLQRVSQVLYLTALKWPSTVFFQNEEDRTHFIAAGLVRASRTQRLPGSGVDVQRFSPRAKPQGGPMRFLLVARLLWAKGVGEFVEAARIVKAQHPDVEFALAGFVDVGNDAAVPRATIEAWEQEGLLTFLGSFDDMVPVYAQADCVVLPSYYREGVPRSLLEAASMGKPIITTDSVGCRDTVAHGVTGWLVKPRDAQVLAEAMVRVLHMPANQAAQVSRQARQRIVAEFDEQIVLDAYGEAIHSARIDSSNPAALAEPLQAFLKNA